jgi:hypothetical protein
MSGSAGRRLQCRPARGGQEVADMVLGSRRRRCRSADAEPAPDPLRDGRPARSQAEARNAIDTSVAVALGTGPGAQLALALGGTFLGTNLTSGGCCPAA